jgi:hypothetical protein
VEVQLLIHRHQARFLNHFRMFFVGGSVEIVQLMCGHSFVKNHFGR